MNLTFSEQNNQILERLLTQYPEKRALLLPVLHLAQEQFGSLNTEVQKYVAQTLELSEADVKEVVSFYTMFHEEPLGKYHVQICHNLSCTLMGAEKLIQCAEKKLNLQAKAVRGETTEDQKFTLTRVECLAACHGAPMIQINDKYYLNLTCKKLEALLDELD